MANTIESTSTTTNPSDDRGKAIESIFSYFTTGGVAYTQNGIDSLRQYCTACLDNEIEAVKLAREQFGQGTNAGIDVLRGIAMGRLEFFLPQHKLLLNHLRTDCIDLSPEARKEIQSIHALLNGWPSNIYRNPYDYGSIYEEVAYPKTAGKNIELLIPGSASPANIYRAHEQALYKRAQSRRSAKIRRKLRTDGANRKLPRDVGVTDDASATEESEMEDEEDGQQEPSKRARRDEISAAIPKVDPSVLFSPSQDGHDEVELPEDFPDSELLKAIQSHSASLYGSRGLMSTDKKPKDTFGTKVPSMIQALDGTALIALGILTQEVVRHSAIPSSSKPIATQPESDFYPRTAGKPGWTMKEGVKRSSGIKVLTDRVLRRLPEGSEIGIRDLVEACAMQQERGEKPLGMEEGYK